MDTIHHAIQWITQYFELYPYMGAVFAFIIAFIESLPIIGTIFPGSVTMTAIGTLIGAGVIPAPITLMLACTGAFFGDCLGYLAGRVYQDEIKACWPFKKHKKWLTKSEAFFSRHGGKSVIIGRFFGPIRSTVPMVAGLLKLSWLRFVFAAIPSAIMWALFYMTPGILLGALSVELPAKQTTEFIVIGVSIIIGLWFVFWAIEHSFKYVSKKCYQYHQALWSRITPRSRLSCIKNTMGITHQPDNASPLVKLSISLLLLVAFAAVWVNTLYPHPPSSFNTVLYTLLQTFHSPGLSHFFIGITLMGTPFTLLINTVITTAFFYIKKQKRMAFYLFTTFFITAVLITCLKHFYYVPRPPLGLSIKHNSSFPSAHTLMSVIYYSLAAYFFSHSLKEKQRWIPYTLATLIITLILLSRLYLGAHWLTDIMASLFLGGAIVTLSTLFYQRKPSLKPLRANQYMTLLLFVVCTFTISIITHQSKLFSRYQQSPITKITTQSHWWSAPLSVTPLIRNNRLGKPFLPFNIQWASHLNKIKQQLINDHWKTLPSKSLINKSIQPLLGTDPLYRQPIFEWQYQYQPPILTMVKQLKQQHTLLEIRLWQSYVYFSDSKQPLWLGTINYHGASHKLIPIRAINRSVYLLKKAPSELTLDTTQFSTKSIRLTPSEIHQLPLNTQWDHSILLIQEKE